MTDLIIGIDPGLSGAVAFYYPQAGGLQIEDMPTFRVQKGAPRTVIKAGKAITKQPERRELNAAGLAQMVEFAIQGKTVRAFVEQVASHPTDGGIAAFAFGRAYGTILGVLAANYLQIDFAAPQAWKRAVGISRGATKDASRQMASNLFPRHAGLFSRVKDDGRAESALIAWYGWQQIRQEAA